ncbi:MAG: sigma-70 family RNA polymerase sigma factor [Pirellulaceae bacterium]|jgi:RNA polymerase sigma factor for flagellar operon FliA|nr:sigma-70 family RNA polymerase sigma factor [Pirellulaceae bacterium]
MTTSQLTREERIAAGQPLVRALALRIFRNIPVRMELDDLIAYGEVGLAEAARDYDAEKGAQFTTFAYYRIRGAIYDGLAKMTWTSRAYYNRLRYERMAAQALREAAEAESSEDDAQWFGNLTAKLGVIYLISHSDTGGGIRDSTIEDPHVGGPALLARREIAELLRTLVAQLPMPERRLIQAVYFEGATLQQAARQTGMSKSWASRLHARVLEQLARELRRRGAAD